MEPGGGGEMAAPPDAFLVRLGPPPEEAAGEGGPAAFVESFWVPLPAGRASELADLARPFALYAFAAELWRRAVAEGHGHMLIGMATAGRAAAAAGCGAELLRPPPRALAPQGYTPLFAVARARRPAEAGPPAPETLDLCLDYRGSGGPGDVSLRPVVFDVGAGKSAAAPRG